MKWCLQKWAVLQELNWCNHFSYSIFKSSYLQSSREMILSNRIFLSKLYTENMWTVRGTNLDSASPSSCLFSQPPWPITPSRWTGAGNTAMALEEAAWSSGTRTDPLWTPACTVWMRTWPPQPTASTRSLSPAPPTIPLTPPLSTSCPALTRWQVSLKLHLL